MQRVRKLSNSLMKPLSGDRERERNKKAEIERENQLVADWKHLNQRQGAILNRSTSNPTKRGASLSRSTSNPLSPKASASTSKHTPPTRPTIIHPEPATEQSRQRLPTREEMVQLQEARRHAGYGPLPDPNKIKGVRAGPKAHVRRSASESHLPVLSYVPFLDRKPTPMMTEAELARQRKAAEEQTAARLRAEDGWRERRLPTGGERDYPSGDEKVREKAGELARMARKQEKEKGSVKTKGGALISPPLTNTNLREDSYSKPPHTVSQPPRKSSSSRTPSRPSETPKPIDYGLHRTSSELAVDRFLKEQQREAEMERRDAMVAAWNAASEPQHRRRPSHDTNKPTVPLKIHKKASSTDITMSSPAVLPPRRSAESDRVADHRDHRKRDQSAHSTRRRENPGPPLSNSHLYREEWVTEKIPRQDKVAVTSRSKSRDVPSASPAPAVQATPPMYPHMDVYMGSSTPASRQRQLSGGSSMGSLSSLGSPLRQPQPMSLSPPRMQRQISTGSSTGSSSKSYPSEMFSLLKRPAQKPAATPPRQGAAPLPSSRSSPGTSTKDVASPKKPTRQPSSSSIAQRREKSVDRIVIYPTDPYGVPLEKELPETPSLYTPTNFGPPSPTTKNYVVPPVPSLPRSVRVGMSATLDTPLSSLHLSPTTKLRQLPGVHHSVEVSKPRASVVAASGFMAEIVTQPLPLPRSSSSHPKKHEHRERSRGRHERREERREERPAAEPAQHVKRIYGPPASASSEQVQRVYVPPAHATQPSRRIYAPSTAIDRTRADPSAVYGSTRSPPANTSTLKSKRSDYGGLYSGYSRP
ncbi:uncharacterized protein C8Q71DRAFT_311670 [Rhodofomes roseus]|uniref:Uncharacterized protein n=1 Tax=Rhodofomes roseus TaxID=34475 RepID=A0ABQ8K4F0_9APHY|nr:uncharacterized protein C8Q71DRAFT_311670 [Rhodofomes roseus]KAH9831251.1 hypothetical protein C8Q71DRAFT_311670 [Rhodofomes roseus]